MNFEDKKNRRKTGYYCSNCGLYGHSFKNCDQSITSYGIILVSLDHFSEEILDLLKNQEQIGEQEGVKYRSIHDIENFSKYQNSVKFLMIQRKHTLGFIEFVRGRYDVKHIDHITFLFKQMTPVEIRRIASSTFEELWGELWENNHNGGNYRTEYNMSREKFLKLKNDDHLSLDFYVSNVKPFWRFAEWGFPKGRRNFQENDLECAKREFREETNYSDENYICLTNIKPLEESFTGTNGVNYKHIYYVGVDLTGREPEINENNRHQMNEIGDIGWFNYNQAIGLIRSHHSDRKRLLTNVYIYFIDLIMSFLN